MGYYSLVDEISVKMVDEISVQCTEVQNVLDSSHFIQTSKTWNYYKLRKKFLQTISFLTENKCKEIFAKLKVRIFWQRSI